MVVITGNQIKPSLIFFNILNRGCFNLFFYNSMKEQVFKLREKYTEKPPLNCQWDGRFVKIDDSQEIWFLYGFPSNFVCSLIFVATDCRV